MPFDIVNTFRPSFIYPEDDNKFLYGYFAMRHKGRKARGRPNYPPLPKVVKTGRKQSVSLRGMRKLNKLEQRAMGHEERARVRELINNHLATAPDLVRRKLIRERHAQSFIIRGDQ